MEKNVRNFSDKEKIKKIFVNIWERYRSLFVITEEDKVYKFKIHKSKQDQIVYIDIGCLINKLCYKNIVDIANGLSHFIALTTDGKIYCWGDNDEGQLGIGDFTYSDIQVNEYLSDKKIIAITCGSYHSLALTNEGVVYAWEYNCSLQVAKNFEKIMKMPTVIGTDVKAISCGCMHSMVISDNGLVSSIGIKNIFGFLDERIQNSSVQQTVNMNVVDIIKIKCGSNHSLMLSIDDDIYGVEFDGLKISNATPITLDLQNKFIDIETHPSHSTSLALSVDMICYKWESIGRNSKSHENRKAYIKCYFGISGSYIPRISFSEDCVINSKTSKFSQRNIESYKRKIENSFEICNFIDFEFETNLKISVLALNNGKVENVENNKLVAYNFQENFSEKIKSTFVRKTENNLFFFIITEEGRVYEFKKFSDNTGNTYLKRKLKSLFFEKVVDFANGLDHFLARTREGKIFLWGNNEYGQLGNGNNDYETYPKLSEYLRNEMIADVCCGDKHSLALTSKGEVYGWGWNLFSQIGNGSKEDVNTPFKIEGFQGKKIKAISCGSKHSIALSENGNVFYWGFILYKGNGEAIVDYPKIPKLVEMNNIIIRKIKCGPDHCLMLSKHGNIFSFGLNHVGQIGTGNKSYQNIPIQLKISNYFVDIESNPFNNTSLALSVDGICYYWGYVEETEILTPQQTRYESIDLCYSKMFVSTKTSNFDALECETDNEYYSEIFISNGKYKENLIEDNLISTGSFGVVFRATDKRNGEALAIKRIPVNESDIEKVSEELRIMMKLKSEYVVECFDAWLEDNYFRKKFKKNLFLVKSNNQQQKYFLGKSHLLHIQMEFCCMDLKECINSLFNEFKQKQNEKINHLNYYIASEVFREILESISYLHKQKPAIIHRDLKPVNILLSNGSSGRFVKVADFGLATFHQFDDQSHPIDKGTPKYMAPEVITNKKYDTKADIYSLGVIIQEIFNIDINNPLSIKNDSFLKRKYHNLYEICCKMMSSQTNFRPNCEKILKKYKKWGICLCEIINDSKCEEIREKIPKTDSMKKSFNTYFIQIKSKYFLESEHKKHKSIVETALEKVF